MKSARGCDCVWLCCNACKLPRGAFFFGSQMSPIGPVRCDCGADRYVLCLV
jgi:hypothetical protein